ncbi:hypothetical protein D3C72_894530 [compost metagenome]
MRPALNRFTHFPQGRDGVCQASPRCGAAQADHPPALKLNKVANGVQGFTLIELLIAIAILAVMTVASWRGIDGMVRAQEQARVYSEEVMVAQAALAQWNTDLNAIERVGATTPIEWNGRVLRITRRSSDINEQGLRVVGWALRNVQGRSHWVRWQSHPLRNAQEWQQAWEMANHAVTNGAIDGNAGNNGDGIPQTTVLMPVRGWQLLYFRGNSWSNPLSSGATDTRTDPNNPTDTRLPDGVRLSLELPAPGALSGTITSDWVNPILGGNKS